MKLIIITQLTVNNIIHICIWVVITEGNNATKNIIRNEQKQMYLSRNSTTSALEEKKASSPSLGLAHWVSMRASTALTAINRQQSKHPKS